MVRARTVGDLASLRDHDLIRHYAATFQAAIIDGAASGTELADAISEAWANAELTDAIAGALTTGSRTLGAASLIPGIGSVAALAGMGSDASSEVARRKALALRWFEIGPAIK